jgi:ABC-2 type transport system permease protein
MILFLVVFHIEITPLIFFLPLIVFFQTIFTIGISLISASLQAYFRDVKYIVELLLMAWFYLTPIFYPLTLVSGISDNLLKLYMLNPFTGIVTFYRLSLLGGYIKSLPPQIDIFYLLIFCLLSCIVIFFLGFIIFRKFEPRFTDLV